jgi:hypothetical protein
MGSFLSGKSCNCGNTRTDGNNVWLHGNRILWREADGLTVVQIQDFNTGRVTSGVTTPDHQLVQINGAISLL